jgi:hypothetical protein
LTLAVSNAGFLRSFVFLPESFQLKSAILDSLNNLVTRLVGDQIARSAIVAIFWALVGLVVYLLIWLVLNFSGELGNDLAITKYVHPRNVDTHSPLRDFVSRVSFQFVTLCVFIFYINLVIGTLLPYFGGLFRTAINDWPSSCEHYLTNERMNRIAWLGQAAMCYATRIPSIFCGGFNQLTEAEQAAANETAPKDLNLWLVSKHEPPLTMEQAPSKTEANLY